MKFALVFATIFIAGALAGSPGYPPSSSSYTHSSPNPLCDLIRFIIKLLSKVAYDALKEYCREYMVKGKSDELTTAAKGDMLSAMFGEFYADKNVPEEDKALMRSMNDYSSYVQNNQWGFDPEAVWDCLKEIFPDLFAYANLRA